MSHGFVRLSWEASNDRRLRSSGIQQQDFTQRKNDSNEDGATEFTRLPPFDRRSFKWLQCWTPRGARPVEHGTRDEKCATEKEWPFCTSDQWGPKCPSGCRIQGLMDKYDHGLLKRVEKIRSLLDQYKGKHRSADLVSKQTYDYLKEKLTIDSGYDNNYYDLAQRLRQRITDMKIRIDRQLRTLAALKDRVKDQVADMQKLEVDIDIKLRSCKGSCEGYTEYSIDQSSYLELDKQVNQLDSQSAQAIESVGTLYVMKSKTLQDSHAVDGIFKSKVIATGAAAQEVQDIFPEVKTVQFVLEHEGSSSFPATISKEPGGNTDLFNLGGGV
ncbi:Fibrinogen alpha chain Fibrinopeptide A Fibrinogen alpha chain Precursor [Larimichthys crocea]|uniref:Fibrinogen alpha chain Fibrinopeptide A Fibrinogen alpha chain n=1 Tax=Larimichthys crocea TaxID=215358 RepID=A0A6G0HKE1_LARCR|nr:Fibrinogen alpha chain Fibrinopeptide A Fibrinogen alpha chain Precursor [Larimichthys crocea]